MYKGFHVKILIITYHFYPDVTPRAFRAFELAKQLAKDGQRVRILLPKSDYDYTEVSKKYNFLVDFVDYKKGLGSVCDTQNKENTSYFFLKKTIRKLFKKTMYCIFPSGRSTKFYFYALYKKLLENDQYYDMIISIATPYDTHIGTAWALGKNKYLRESKIKVADYGDPLYKNPALPDCPFYFWIDKFIASKFDFITIPTKKALSIYKNFKKEEFIKIIPQGFDFSEIKIANYQVNDVPTFGYAGMFYEDIRNPRSLLELLLKLRMKNIDFKFIIYTETGNMNNMMLLDKYKKELGEQLLIMQAIPRVNVIFELSKMDFLINIENLSSSQIPSKLIDYALTKRPIYSFTQEDFSAVIFQQFLNRNYSEKYEINNIDNFNIENICKQFIKLDNGK